MGMSEEENLKLTEEYVEYPFDLVEIDGDVVACVDENLRRPNRRAHDHCPET